MSRPAVLPAVRIVLLRITSAFDHSVWACHYFVDLLVLHCASCDIIKNVFGCGRSSRDQRYPVQLCGANALI